MIEITFSPIFPFAHSFRNGNNKRDVDGREGRERKGAILVGSNEDIIIQKSFH